MTGPWTRLAAVAVVTTLVLAGGTAGITPTATAARPRNGTVSPDAVTEGTTTTLTVEFTVAGVSADGASDRVALTLPGQARLERVDSVAATAEGANVLVGDPRVDEGGDGSRLVVETNATGGGVVEVHVVATATVTVTNVDATTAVPVTVDVDDSTTDDVTGRPVASLTVRNSAATRGSFDDVPGAFDTRRSSGLVYPGATVFRGEADVAFGGGLATQLRGLSGRAQGHLLSTPIPADQVTGMYSNDGLGDTPRVTVETPRVTASAVRDAAGANVSGDTVSPGTAANLTVVAGSNFETAEDLRLVVRNENGVDVTPQALAPASPNPRQREAENLLPEDADATLARWRVNLSDVDAGGRFTLAVHGTDDLTNGPAVRSTTVTVDSPRQVSITAAGSVSQGEVLRYEIRGSDAADAHVVTVGMREFRREATPRNMARALRRVDGVTATGVVLQNGRVLRRDDGFGVTRSDVRFAFANVSVDDRTGLGVGELWTRYLATGDVDVHLFPAAARLPSLGDERDRAGVTVAAPVLRLDAPRATYVAGSAAEIRGVAPGVGSVVLYAREGGDYELVDLNGPEPGVGAGLAVREGDFRRSEVFLSRGDAGGNAVLASPGVVEVGVVPTAAVRTADGDVPRRLDPAAFEAANGSSTAIRVLPRALTAAAETYGGDVAESDARVGVSGYAPRSTDVGVAVVDDRGAVAYETVPVDDDDAFAAVVPTPTLTTGCVSVHVVALGPDGHLGAGSLPGTSGGGFDDLARYLSTFDEGGSRADTTGEQVRRSIRQQTADRPGSDDLLSVETVRYAPDRVAVERAFSARESATGGVGPVAADGSMVVEGTTNLRPHDDPITVSLRSDGDVRAVESVSQWGPDGVWRVTLSTADLAPGTYTLEADGGLDVRRTTVDLVSEESTPTNETTPTDGETPTNETTPTDGTPTAPATDAPTAGTTAAAGDAPATTGDGSGFGVAVAVVAVLLAAVVRRRRDD